ncbi:hypothetical protein Tco_0326143 [Tanacetum coccineum]
MPPKRTYAAASMTAAAIEQLIMKLFETTLMVMATEATIRALESEELHALRMELVFHISNCAVENQVKFATCTFVGNALTWWNSHMKAVTQVVAYAMD